MGLAHLAYTRFLDMGVVALVALGGWVLLDQGNNTESLILFAGALFATVTLALICLGKIFRWLAEAVSRLLKRAGGWGQRIGQAVSESFSDAANCVDALHPRRIAMSIGLTMALWVLAFLVMGLAVDTSYQELGFAHLMIAGSTTIVASFLPVGIIGTFGVLEAGWILGFTSVGVPLEDAVATAVVYSLTTLLGAILLAIPGYTATKNPTKQKDENSR